MPYLLERTLALENEAVDFGFQWETTDQIVKQIKSELVEINTHLHQGIAQCNQNELQEEIGDLLHAVFSLCIFCQFKPDVTLHKTLNKFEKRLRFVKQLAQQQGLQHLKGRSFDELMTFWNEAKQLEKDTSIVEQEPWDIITPINDFQLDERLHTSSLLLIDWPLSRVLLKNNANYPWFILVPRRKEITEMTQLSKVDRYQLMDEIQQLSLIVQAMFQPDKINVGSLGNIVAQCHLHVVARFCHDPLWPQGIWQAILEEKPYVEPDSLITDLLDRLSSVAF